MKAYDETWSEIIIKVLGQMAIWGIPALIMLGIIGWLCTPKASADFITVYEPEKGYCEIHDNGLDLREQLLFTDNKGE